MVYQKIAAVEAKKRLDSGENIVILDVRTQAEFMEKRIPKSILIPVDSLRKEAEERLPDKNTTIFVYCLSGRRTDAALKLLAKLGYQNLYNLGGIIHWPYETESGK